MSQQRRSLLLAMCLGLCCMSGWSKSANKQDESLKEYVAKLQSSTVAMPSTTASGSLWSDGGALTNLASDYKARSVGDLIVISIVEQTLAQASGTVASQRTFNTTSGVSGLVGRINTGGVNPLVAANSDTQLKGQAQTASTSSLRTSVAGQVIAVLPNGNLVVEAHRDVLMNDERQTVILRGVARPGDLAANNVVLSSQLSNLEVELRGKGVISDGTRRPNWIVRALLRLLTF
jgi:flagellar L-ring protein precursor FlgH